MQMVNVQAVNDMTNAILEDATTSHGRFNAGLNYPAAMGAVGVWLWELLYGDEISREAVKILLERIVEEYKTKCNTGTQTALE